MFNWTEKVCRKYVHSDVAKIVDHARIVVRVTREGKIISSEIRDNFGLNVIAVLGPGEYRGYDFEEIILLEIGIGTIRPYGSSHSPTRCNVSQRYNRSFLSESAYLALRPHLFSLVEEIAFDRIKNWKQSTTKVKSSKFFLSKKNHNLIEDECYVTIHKGVIFSVSTKDALLARDFRGFDLAHPGVSGKLANIGRYCDKALNGSYDHSWLTPNRLNRLLTFDASGPTAVYCQLATLDDKGFLLPHRAKKISSYIKEERKELFLRIMRKAVGKEMVKAVTSESDNKSNGSNGDSEIARNWIARINRETNKYLATEVAIPSLAEAENEPF